MSRKMTMIQAINLALHDAMEDEARVLVLGEDVADTEGGGVIKITSGLSNKFGAHRVRSTPIAEQAIIGAAVGAAILGYRPVAEIMLMNFTMVAMDMIVNHAAKLRFMSGGQTSVPLTIRTMTGSGMGNGGQHSDFLEGWFAHTAGIKVVVPSNPADAYGLLRACIDDPDPCVFVETMPILWTPGDAPEPGSRVLIGQARIVREGQDATIITYGRQVFDAMATATALESEGVSVEVIDLRSVSPWDRDAVIASVRKTGGAVVVHEAVRNFGPGAEISSVLHESLFDHLRAPVGRVGAKFSPVPFSKPLETHFAPIVSEISDAVRRVARPA
ncbi:alpha-ketoacid dehydrogenase subunit beta [Luteimonas sp. A501]